MISEVVGVVHIESRYTTIVVKSIARGRGETRPLRAGRQGLTPAPTVHSSAKWRELHFALGRLKAKTCAAHSFEGLMVRPCLMVEVEIWSEKKARRRAPCGEFGDARIYPYLSEDCNWHTARE